MTAKTLGIAIDYLDNLAIHPPCPGRLYTAAELDAMLDYFAGLGVRRVYWLYDRWGHIYDAPIGDQPDTLSYVTAGCHRRGQSCIAVIKPFETGIRHDTLPAHLAPPPNAVAGEQGWHYFAEPFVAAHPEYRLKLRRPAPLPEAGGPVTGVRLVKADDAETTLQPDQVRILWSDHNGGHQPYAGPARTFVRIEERNGTPCRVLGWDGLQLPAAARYLLLEYAGEEGGGDFANNGQAILELHGAGGRLPSLGSQGRVRRAYDLARAAGIDFPPATAEVLADDTRREAAFRHHLYYELNDHGCPEVRFNRPGGYAAHTLAREAYVPGALHPAYPEVRAFWEGWVAAALDAGVDGVGLRVANHASHTRFPEEVGFNPPALAAYARRTCREGVTPDEVDRDFFRTVNGSFYTEFVRAASAAVRGRGKRFYHFIQPLMDELRPNVIGNVPATFHFDWRGWLREGLLDGLCLRPMGLDGPAGAAPFGDLVGATARAFGVEMHFTNGNGLLTLDLSRWDPAADLERVRTSPLYDGYILYEAAGVYGIDPDGTVHASEALRDATAPWREPS
jgi:hypothetical protein